MRVLRIQQGARLRWPRSWLMCMRPMLHVTGVIVDLWSSRLTLALKSYCCELADTMPEAIQHAARDMPARVPHATSRQLAAAHRSPRAVTPAQRALHSRPHPPICNQAAQGRAGEELRDAPYLLPEAEIARRAAEAWERGATEVCIQGGIHPEFTGASPARRPVWRRSLSRVRVRARAEGAPRAQACPLRAGAARSRAQAAAGAGAPRACMRPRPSGRLCERRRAAARPRRRDVPAHAGGGQGGRAAGARARILPLEVWHGAASLRWPLARFLAALAWAACRAPRPRCCATPCARPSAPTS